MCYKSIFSSGKIQFYFGLTSTDIKRQIFLFFSSCFDASVLSLNASEYKRQFGANGQWTLHYLWRNESVIWSHVYTFTHIICRWTLHVRAFLPDVFCGARKSAEERKWRPKMSNCAWPRIRSFQTKRTRRERVTWHGKECNEAKTSRLSICQRKMSLLSKSTEEKRRDQLLGRKSGSDRSANLDLNFSTTLVDR